ncbi:hypothetical protein GCM10023116_29080 [Kistimonas scapharcae]|uniref:Acid stress chaperone HdeA n=1 Tax=Kistimonas scapharcae TaxID=1036133 RepID=A0ABP8V3F0_9GAMM
MGIKTLCLACGLAALSCTAFADSNKKSNVPPKPITQWTCADFLDIEDDFQPYAVGWATAYSKSGKPEDTDFDVDGVNTITPYIVTVCSQNRKASFWAKVKDKVEKMDADVKKHM